jgi:DNA repair protein RecN (Recombination protein N)
LLLEVSISDFAIIDRLKLALGPGLNVLTGETGAGKSIIIDAVELALGGRASTEQVRSGAERTYVEVVFDLGALPATRDTLARTGFLDSPDEPLLVVGREVARTGRSLTRLNGRTATVSSLREVSQDLLDLHGQHEHQSLLRPERHLPLLDAFGGPELARLGEETRRLYGAIAARRTALARLSGDARDRARRLDLLRFQVGEIDGAALTVGEEETLRDERSVLANAEKLYAATSSTYAALYEGDPRQASLLDALAALTAGIGGVADLDRTLIPVREALESARFQIEEAARELRRYRDRVQADPERLAEVDARLDLISQLRRKYGESVAEVLQFRTQAAAELESVETNEEAAGRLASELAEFGRLFTAAGLALSEARRQAAGTLVAQVTGELDDLSMPRTVFEVRLMRNEAPDGLAVDGRTFSFGPHGFDSAEFLLSTNPGEPPRALARIASGGELARIMLALKTILARVDNVPTLIFDEVDAGIGGRAALAVAHKLAGLARHRQVICVTHLAPIACLADAHFSIAKTVEGGRTITRVSPLAGEDRVAEIARMLGGAPEREASLNHARALLVEAETFKAELSSTAPA